MTVLATTGTALAQPSKEATALVQVDSAKVRGTSEKEVIAFKGIPFAQLPVGALRWRLPQPVRPWEGVREANAFGPDPVQPAHLAPPGASTSEDCLYVNVWRPAADADKPLPVVVWIYGGGLV